MSESTSLKIGLIEAPFGPAAWPSIGTSLLKAKLQDHGHTAQVLYLNLDFLRYLGRPSLETIAQYHDISDAFCIHLGEWIFGPAAFPDAPWESLDRAFIEKVNKSGERKLLRIARHLRKVVPEYISAMASKIEAMELDVIGFANSYSQLNASMALARSIRASSPNLPVMMGGSGCAGDMGGAILDLCTDIDAVVTGEADEIIVQLCEVLSGQVPVEQGLLPGVIYRDEWMKGVPASKPRRVRELSVLSIPDYADYFEALPEELQDIMPHYIPIEASRGCWWGAKNHCTFCGLSDMRMTYYSKLAGSFLEELAELTRRHQPSRFMVVDNIMPHTYHSTVVPHLTDATDHAELFLEVKANLTPEHVSGLASGGVLKVQPGIESLSTPVLKLMQKGITAIDNIYTLRLCKENGVQAHWSILYGFEGECYDDYVATSELIRRIQHIQAPLGLNHVQLERYSPMALDPKRFGFSNIRPSEWYQYCYPVCDEILERLAYRFDADCSEEQTRLMKEIALLVGPRVKQWQEMQSLHALDLTDTDGKKAVISRRVGGWQQEYHLHEVALDLFVELNQPRRLSGIGIDRDSYTSSYPYSDRSLQSELARMGNSRNRVVRLDSCELEEAYLSLLGHGLIVEEGARAVSVVLDKVTNSPAAQHTSCNMQKEGES